MKIEKLIYEVCQGHITDIRPSAIPCGLCEIDDRNKECPHYRPVTIREIIVTKEEPNDRKI